MFGAKRKARKIQVAEDDEEPTVAPAPPADEPMQDGKSSLVVQASIFPLISSHHRHLTDAHSTHPAAGPPSISPAAVKFTRRPAKSSSLRKSINVHGDEDATQAGRGGDDDDEDDARPAVIRPSISRSGSTKIKKKASSSRLSFGGDTTAASDPADSTSSPFATPKKNPSAANLAQRAAENSAVRASTTSRNLPTRSFGVERERAPSYSREYLEELQSSTPNAPTSLAGSGADDNDTMILDDAELDGAVFVPMADLSMTSAGDAAARYIPSAAEVREKKERRARLAKEGDAYKPDQDGEEDEDGFISLLPSRKKKDDTRLIAEDEDLGEGYDDYVEDGRLELGRKGETAARRRQRAEMAELIDAAEGGASEEQDSDSDAERQAAYEEAQTRAAMDGLRNIAGSGQPGDVDDGGGVGLGVGRLVIPRMRPLPELGDSLARMRELVAEMEAQVTAKRKRIEAVEKEKREILDREREVQNVLNQAGLKYQSAMGIQTETAIDPEKLAAESPMRGVEQLGSGERGLESFGTPTRRPEADQMEE